MKRQWGPSAPAAQIAGAFVGQSFSKVLVVTDFSDTANSAIPFAFALAGPTTQVHLVHVVEHDEVPNPLYAHYSSDDFSDPDKRRELVAKVEAHLRTLVPADARKVQTECAVAFHREIAPGIVAEAQARGVDVIVIGSHGRTGLAHLLMGSVAEYILRNSDIPVLIVPHRP
ncbi:MAG: universal stress protein [Candidatus Lambdaproteobacteria bacterium]|nr:universal stress protein [Candidatus Lambdaproteobacteria bacterium]